MSTQMFRVTLFITAKTWKQPRYSSIGEWINYGKSIQRTIIIQRKRNELSNYKDMEET